MKDFIKAMRALSDSNRRKIIKGKGGQIFSIDNLKAKGGQIFSIDNLS